MTRPINRAASKIGSVADRGDQPAVPYAPDAQALLNEAQRIANQRQHSTVTGGDILRACLSTSEAMVGTPVRVAVRRLPRATVLKIEETLHIEEGLR